MLGYGKRVKERYRLKVLRNINQGKKNAEQFDQQSLLFRGVFFVVFSLLLLLLTLNTTMNTTKEDIN